LRDREEIVWDIQFQDTLEKYKDIIILNREKRETYLNTVIEYILENPKETNSQIMKKFSSIKGIKRITEDALFYVLVEKKTKV
jgi:hypothetical protein